MFIKEVLPVPWPRPNNIQSRWSIEILAEADSPGEYDVIITNYLMTQTIKGLFSLFMYCDFFNLFQEPLTGSMIDMLWLTWWSGFSRVFCLLQSRNKLLYSCYSSGKAWQLFTKVSLCWTMQGQCGHKWEGDDQPGHSSININTHSLAIFLCMKLSSATQGLLAACWILILRFSK